MSTIKSRALVIGALALALAGVAATPAHAVPAADGVDQVLAIAGSDTTEDVMGDLAAAWNSPATINTDPDVASNIPVQAAAGSPGFTVPADPTCGSRTYVNRAEASPPTTFPAPNGSTDGKNALAGVTPFPTDNTTTQCIDIARSSSGPSGSDPAGFQYYAFALDAISWAGWAGPSPDTLTADQIRGIYNCTFDDWSEVGGTAGPIQRYMPQNGSGTLSFFIGATYLGFDPRNFSSAGCPAVIQIQEHDLTTIDTAAEQARAISPFSVAQWVVQGNGRETDKRSGAFIGQVSGVSPVSGTAPNLAPNTTFVTEGNFGVRRVYNIINTAQASSGQALRLVGFDATGPGFLCNPADTAVATAITQNGFVRFSPSGTNGTCRGESL